MAKTDAFRDLTNLGFTSLGADAPPAPRRKNGQKSSLVSPARVPELRTPDENLLLEFSPQPEQPRSEVLEKQAAEIRALRAEKAALTVLGRGFFACQIQRVARGAEVRAWCSYAKPLVVALQSRFRAHLKQAAYQRARRAATIIVAKYRAAIARADYVFLREAAIELQRFSRGKTRREEYKNLQRATLVASKNARAALCQWYRRRALASALVISKTYRGHSIRRVDPKRSALRFHQATLSNRLVGLLLSPPDNAVVLTCQPGAKIEGELKPDGQPFGLTLKFDHATGDLGLFFSFNPRADIRHIIAPWKIRGNLVVNVLNQKRLGADLKIVLEQPETPSFRPSAYTVGVQRLLTKKILEEQFYLQQQNSSVVLAVVNEYQPEELCPQDKHPQQDPFKSFACFTRAVPISTASRAFGAAVV